MEWISIAPLRGLHGLPDQLTLPFRFDEQTCLEAIPSWATDSTADEIDQLLPRIRDSVKEYHTEYCISTRYAAEALGTPDDSLLGSEKQTKQDTAVERLHVACLALWISRPTATGFQQVAHVESTDDGILVRKYTEFDRFLALRSYEASVFQLDDFSKAREFYPGLLNLPREGTVITAVGLLASAITQRQWHLRFLVLWLALEALFGPSDARETTYRISHRIGLFLGNDKADAQRLFRLVKESYTWRSKIVHGLRLAKLKPDKAGSLISILENIVRNCVTKLLQETDTMSILETKNRESYLDELVYT